MARPHRTIQRIRLLEEGPRLAHSATDRVSAWEHSLMLEARAAGSVHWLPGKDGPGYGYGRRRPMHGRVSRRQDTMTLRVYAEAYAVLPLPLHSFLRVPPAAWAMLMGDISRDS